MFKKLTAVLVFCLTINGINGWVCPKDQTPFAPCRCRNLLRLLPQIYCDVSENINLENIFEKLSKTLTEKHFHELYLNTTGITEIKANTTKDILFEKIKIEGSKYLSKIAAMAFNGTDKTTVTLDFENNPSLNTANIFELMSKFTALHEFDLVGKSISKLPQNAFSSINTLNVIRLHKTSIDFIPDNAFAFEKPATNHLVIDLSDNQYINSTSFSVNSLSNTRRATHLLLFNVNGVTYLNESVFLPFLTNNEENAIEFSPKRFDCNDCRNYWVKKHSDISQRVKIGVCNNGKMFNDPDNFKCD